MPAERTSSCFYFAYGSNLWMPRLAERTPSCEVVGTAWLSHHQLRFHKHGHDDSAKCDAFYTGEEQDRVEGVVYRIARTEQRILDQVEGGYDALQVEVELAGRLVAALTYRAREDLIRDDLQPFDWYHALVCRGARQQGLSSDYCDWLEAFPAIEDSNQQRRLEHWRLLDIEP